MSRAPAERSSFALRQPTQPLYVWLRDGRTISGVKQFIDSEAQVWRTTFAFTGVGCTFVGPLLPALVTKWQLHDHQAGFLVSCLFLGSFTGTLCLSGRLDRTLRRGSYAAFVGMLLFAWCFHLSHGFAAGAASLGILGFGLGQLMSSMNLLVGAGTPEKRSASLAGVAAAWCVGAVLSPALTTVLISAVPVFWRLVFFASLFLWPTIRTHGRELPRTVTVDAVGEVDMDRLKLLRVTLLCATAFLIYGGIEASIAAWMPLFAARYQLGSVAVSQWIISVFWTGLILGRIVLARMVKLSWEGTILRSSIVTTAGCLLWLILTPSPGALYVMCGVAGFCLGPVFPLLLSATIDTGLSSRSLGVILAACGLGSAVFPALLGFVSNVSSLRVGMIVPLFGLIVLLLLRWQPPGHARVFGQLEPM